MSQDDFLFILGAGIKTLSAGITGAFSLTGGSILWGNSESLSDESFSAIGDCSTNN